MNKSRKARENSFRYQRVDLSREDSTDSEDDLDKILGPSTSPSMHNGVKIFIKSHSNFQNQLYSMVPNNRAHAAQFFPYLALHKIT